MKEIDLAIKGARIVTSSDIIEGNLYVSAGKVVCIGQIDLSSKEEVDAGGLILLPGMVDAHVHFMDPGETSREDFLKGSSAAAVAGVTTVIEHTHASPVYNGQDLRAKAEYLKDRSFVDFGLGAHFPKGDIDDIGEVIREGAAFIKVLTCTTHGISGVGNGPLLKAMSRFGEEGIPFLIHAEDESLTKIAEADLRATGREDGMVVPDWRSRLAEQIAVRAVSQLSEASGAPTVIAHCSNSSVVDLIAEYRSRKVPIRAEGCPQYFFLKEEEIQEMGGFRKFTPPARALSSQDLEAMWERLRNGAITYVASDHAPATVSQKKGGSIWDVPFGLPGIDTTLPLMLDAVAKGRMTFQRLVEVYAKEPACLYGFYPRKGALQVGGDADFILVDPGATYVLEDKDIKSKAGWTPYAGVTLKGRVMKTYLRGRKIAEGRNCIGTAGWGRFLPGPGYKGITTHRVERRA
jgi:dihydroorotase (multifunctional complex type)